MLATLTLALVSSLAPPALSAEPAPTGEQSVAPPSSLSWEVDEGCPEVEHFIALLRRFLPTLGPLLVDGEVEEAALAQIELRIHAASLDSWEVELKLSSALGHERRAFEAERCELAVEAAALVVSVSLDPVLVVARTGVPEPEGPEPEGPEPEGAEPKGAEPKGAEQPGPEQPGPARGAVSEPEQPEQPSPSPGLEAVPLSRAGRGSRAEERGAWGRVGVSATIAGAYGPLQAGSWALGGQLALLGEDYRVELSGAWHPPLNLPLELESSPDAQLSGRFDAWRVGARGCWVPRRGTLEFPLCALLEGGEVRGEGLAPIPVTRREATPYLGAGLGAWLWWAPVSRFALGLGTEGVASLLARGFSVDGVEVQRYAPVGVRGMAGLELRFP